MSNLNQKFWNNYYKKTNDNISKQSSFAKFVYENYIEQYNKENIFLKIADLGSGNCRDSKFFSQKGNMSYAIDYNGILDKEYPKCKLINEDVEQILSNNKLQISFDIIYMRWFLHAMPYNKSYNIFKYSVNNLKPGGLICVEVRSLNDLELKKKSIYNEIDNSYTTTHKRWLYSIELCKKLAEENNCEILYCEEGYFSPNKDTETNNPLLIRIVYKNNEL